MWGNPLGVASTQGWIGASLDTHKSLAFIGTWQYKGPKKKLNEGKSMPLGSEGADYRTADEFQGHRLGVLQ
jgi:hypothetical protein